MSPKAHYALMWRVQCYGIAIAAICLVGFILAALDNRLSLLREALLLAGLQLPNDIQVAASAIFFGALIIVCLAAPRIAFRRFIPARCPQCGGAAYLRVTSPVRYICQNCGHCAATENWEAAG
jgi:hypothetical protein